MKKNLMRLTASLGATALLAGSMLAGAAPTMANSCPAGQAWVDLGYGGGYCTTPSQFGGSSDGNVDFGGDGGGEIGQAPAPPPAYTPPPAPAPKPPAYT